MSDEARVTLLTAIAAVQHDVQKVVFDKTNPHFNSRFVSRTALLEALQPSLQKHGLVMTQGVVSNCMGSNPAMETRVYHVETGDSLILCTYPLTFSPNLPQKFAAECTYASRYSLQMAFCIAVGEDDDGESSMDWREWGRQLIAKIQACQSLGEMGKLESENIGLLNEFGKAMGQDNLEYLRKAMQERTKQLRMGGI